MKLYKISQNIEYLNKLGVPAEYQQDILNYLMSLDKDTRKTILRKIKKNPTMNLSEIKELETDTKKDYLRGQGYDEKIVDEATAISPKYAVWFAREMKKYQDEGAKNYQNLINFWEKITQKYGVKTGSEAWDKMTEEEMGMERDLRYGGHKLDPESDRFSLEAPWKDRKLNPEKKPISFIVDYIKQNDPDIMSMSYKDALKASDEWHDELAKKAQEETAKSYVSHNVVHRFPNGWEIVELEAGDCEPEGELMGHCVGGYAQDVEEGKTQIFSLRDEKNKPHATIEMNIYNTKDIIKGEDPEWRAELVQIQGKEDTEPIPEYREMLKQWFNALKEKGYKFDPMTGEDYYGNVNVKDLEEEMQFNNYGIPIDVPGIGGDAQTYYENILEAFQEASSGSHWSERAARSYVDNIVSYAEQAEELDELQDALDGFTTKTRTSEGKIVDKHQSFYDLVSDWWMESQDFIEFKNPRPDEPIKEDFIMTPDISKQQPEFEGMPEPQEKINEEAYNQAIQEYEEKENAYEKELSEHERYFEPHIFVNYVHDAITRAKAEQDKSKQGLKEVATSTAKTKMKTKIYKIASNEGKIPNAYMSSEYTKALKLYEEEHPSLSKKYSDLIKDLPSPRKIQQDFSMQECKIIYETLDYLWKKITGEHIIQEKEIVEAPESLFGNYWLIKNGILLKGINHFGIIKNNPILFCTLLKLNGMTLQEYLSNRPHKLIEFILNNGGVRLFVNKDKKLYAQMSSDTYGKWGKDKIKKLDFNPKIVKVIDFKRPYNGWNSGITIKL